MSFLVLFRSMFFFGWNFYICRMKISIFTIFLTPYNFAFFVSQGYQLSSRESWSTIFQTFSFYVFTNMFMYSFFCLFVLKHTHTNISICIYTYKHIFINMYLCQILLNKEHYMAFYYDTQWSHGCSLYEVATERSTWETSWRHFSAAGESVGGGYMSCCPWIVIFVCVMLVII